MRTQTHGEKRRVVFAGTGHAHLHSLARTAELVRRGFEVVAVAPETFWYSGLATGVLGARYAPEDDQVDVAALVARGGGRFLRERIVAIEPGARCVRTESGARLGYDVLSLNLGSEARPLAGDESRVFPIKPLHHLWRLRQALEVARAAGERPRVLIAGGGASGCEIAANVRALLGAGVGIMVAARGGEIAPAFPPGARRALTAWLARRGIEVRTHAGIRRVEDGVAWTESGERLACDFLVNATGLHAPPILRQSGLPVSETGTLLVDDFLRSTGDPRIFGGGDCIHFTRRPLAKVGVYAVRAAPVLLRNLVATLEGRPLLAFRPQRHFLLILNLGAGRGLAVWRSLHWSGRAAFWLKDFLDRRFLARHRP